MDFSPSFHPPQSYRFSTPVYEGPLDLLLNLIERSELDITRLALAQVTDQFLEHLHALADVSETQNPAGEVSYFLVIAAKLLQIKSEVLLPRPPQREAGEEDPGEALAQQLITYKRFKEIAILLAEREALSYRTYPRMAPPPKGEPTLDLKGLAIDDLVAAALLVLSQVDAKLELGTVVAPPRVTIREKISIIANYLRLYQHGTFQHFVLDKSVRLDIVVTFLALLELVKRSLVSAHQLQLFGDIEIETCGDWGEYEHLELEFGE